MEIRPSFSPPRRDIRTGEPGAAEVYTQRLDNLNSKYESLVQLLSQRLRTAIEVSGAEGLVSTSRENFFLAKLFQNLNLQNYAETFHRPLRTYRVNIGSPAMDEVDHDDTYISYSKAE